MRTLKFSIPYKRALHHAEYILFLNNVAHKHKSTTSSSTHPMDHTLSYCLMKMDKVGNSQEIKLLN